MKCELSLSINLLSRRIYPQDPKGFEDNRFLIHYSEFIFCVIYDLFFVPSKDPLIQVLLLDILTMQFSNLF